MCNCASSMTKRCGRLIPSRVLSIVLLSMLTQRGAPGARKFLSRTQKVAVILLCICVFLHVCVLFHLLVDLFYFLHNLGTFSMSNILTGLPETQVLRWKRENEVSKKNPDNAGRGDTWLSSGEAMVAFPPLLYHSVSQVS